MQSNQIKILGNAEFNINCFIFLNQHYIPQEVNYELQNTQWTITYKDYQAFNWKAYFKQMVKSSVYGLKLYNNFYSKIIEEIQNVNFINLKWLQLSYNNINNIEPLSQMQFVSLEYLRLDNNQIIRLKSLKKISCKLIDALHLHNNPLTEINCLSQIRFNSSRLISLCIKSNLQSVNKINDYDLSGLLKLNSKTANEIQTSSFLRIEQYKVRQMITKKFPRLNWSWNQE